MKVDEIIERIYKELEKLRLSRALLLSKIKMNEDEFGFNILINRPKLPIIVHVFCEIEKVDLNDSDWCIFVKYLLYCVSNLYWQYRLDKIQKEKVIKIYSRGTMKISFSQSLNMLDDYTRFLHFYKKIRGGKIDQEYIDNMVNEINKYSILGDLMCAKTDIDPKASNLNFWRIDRILPMTFFYDVYSYEYKYVQIVKYLRKNEYIDNDNRFLLNSSLTKEIKNKVFVAHEFNNKESQEAVEIITDVCRENGFIAFSLEENFSIGNIDSIIYNEIKNSYLVIGIITPQKKGDLFKYNANVFFELGLAKGFNNDILPIYKTDLDISDLDIIRLPFDISSHSAIIYKDKKNLRKQLTIALKSIKK